jgi:hypothetical protein
MNIGFSSTQGKYHRKMLIPIIPLLIYPLGQLGTVHGLCLAITLKVECNTILFKMDLISKFLWKSHLKK